MKYFVTIKSDQSHSFQGSNALANFSQVQQFFSKDSTRLDDDFRIVEIYRGSGSPSSNMRLIMNLKREQAMAIPNGMVFALHPPNLFAVLVEGSHELSITTDDSCLTQPVVDVDFFFTGNCPFAEAQLLPSCPICLSRIERAVCGIQTLSCKDLFHPCCQKSAQEISSDCHACRALQQKESLGCSSCNGSENLWICLLCGNVGCGRYKGGHAHDHYLRTRHDFAVKLDSHHIWDYSGDHYVHRTIKSAEGTVVEVCEGTGQEPEIVEADDDFYNEITLAQLESQRSYFQIQIETLKNKHKHQLHAMELDSKSALHETRKELKDCEADHRILKELRERLQDALRKSRAANEELTKDLEVEKRMSTSLAQKINHLETKVGMLLDERQDLEGQVTDLMKHLEVLDLVQKTGNDPEIVEGKAFIRPTSTKGKKK